MPCSTYSAVQQPSTDLLRSLNMGEQLQFSISAVFSAPAVVELRPASWRRVHLQRHGLNLELQAFNNATFRCGVSQPICTCMLHTCDVLASHRTVRHAQYQHAAHNCEMRMHALLVLMYACNGTVTVYPLAGLGLNITCLRAAPRQSRVARECSVLFVA
jgi:hypothetical protein